MIIKKGCAPLFLIPFLLLVLFVVREGKVVRREIRLGIEQGSRVQVVEGLKPGDQVVVAGMNSITDGAAVRVEKAESGQRQPGEQEQ